MQQSHTYHIHTIQSTDQKCGKSVPAPTLNLNENQLDEKEHRSDNTGFAKWRVKCFYDSLVQDSSLVFQMKFSGKNPPLRKARIRYRQP